MNKIILHIEKRGMRTIKYHKVYKIAAILLDDYYGPNKLSPISQSTLRDVLMQ